MGQIKYEAFLRTVELGSLTKAGEALGYTQSGISHMLNSLEDECGLRLLHRDRAGVQTTSDGQTLIPYFQALCASQRELDLVLEELRGGESGLLRVATFSSIASCWLPSIFKEFQQRYPNVEFELFEVKDNQDAIELLRRRQVDCGFVLDGPGLDMERVFLHRDPLMAMLPPSHELAQADFFPGAAMDRYPYIKLDESYGATNTFMRLVEHSFSLHHKQPQVKFVVRDDYSAMAMIAHEHGYSILPRLMLDNSPHQLACLPLEIPAWRDICLALNGAPTLLAQRFVQAARDWVRGRYGEEER